MVLPIVKYPNPILRKNADQIVFPLSKEIKKLTRDMFATVEKAQGVGLAAPQVGVSARLIVINLEHLKIPAFVLYNPHITKSSKEEVEIEEGCLSIPGVYGFVSRPKKVTIQGQSINGGIVEFADDGWVARVAQHEIDHINGILIIDKIKKYTEGAEVAKRKRLKG